MFNKNKKEKKTYGIVGIGRFGFALALELAASDSELIVIDKDEEKIRDLRDVTENAYVVKNFDKKNLMETGIQNCDIAVVCIGEHIDTSILTTLNLVSMNIPTVISKATSTEHGIILEKLGAEVVYPERDMAVRLANRLETTQILDLVQFSEKINVSKMQISDQIIGKTVLDVNFRGNFGLNIIAIENNGKVIEMVTPDYKFRKNDILFLVGGKEEIMKLNDWLNS